MSIPRLLFRINAFLVRHLGPRRYFPDYFNNSCFSPFQPIMDFMFIKYIPLGKNREGRFQILPLASKGSRARITIYEASSMRGAHARSSTTTFSPSLVLRTVCACTCFNGGKLRLRYVESPAQQPGRASPEPEVVPHVHTPEPWGLKSPAPPSIPAHPRFPFSLSSEHALSSRVPLRL